MLQVDLRELARGPVDTQGQLAGNDPLFEGLDGALAEPVRVAGRLQAAGGGGFYWRGSPRPRGAARVGGARRARGPGGGRVAAGWRAAGEGRFYGRASLRTRMAGQCRRCL